MVNKYIKTKSITGLNVYQKAKAADRVLSSIVFELTTRCNNQCLHCYINQSENDELVKSSELSFDTIRQLIDDAFSLGTLWVLFTGGEPLLREDFTEIYKYCKQKGMLVSIFSNATLITENHVRLFKKYRPREIEITVYGVTKKTYAKVTGRPDLFEKSLQGIKLLKNAGLPLALKTTIMRSNLSEFNAIANFCKNNSNRIFRFDPFLHMRLDKNQTKNKKIKAQRLSNEEILLIEQSDKKRFSLLKEKCKKLNDPQTADKINLLFRCRAGIDQGYIDSTGQFKLCSFLCRNDLTYNLLTGSLKDAWRNFVPKIRSMKSDNPFYLDNCSQCNIRDLCMWCPARSELETSKLDEYLKEYCLLAHKRVDLAQKK